MNNYDFVGRHPLGHRGTPCACVRGMHNNLLWGVAKIIVLLVCDVLPMPMATKGDSSPVGSTIPVSK